MHSLNQKMSEVAIPEAKIHLRSDGIVHVKILAHTHITPDVQRRLIEAYYEVTDEQRPFLFEGEEFVSISKEARENALELEDRSPVKASAIVTRNLGQKILADYYYRNHRPKRPLKIFNRMNDALKWLETLNEDVQTG